MGQYTASAAYYAEFVTANPTTGVAADADSLPVATATRNGVDDVAFTLTVANIDTGRYKITGTVPAYSTGDRVHVSIAATVGGVSGKAVVDSFQVVPAKTPATLAAGDIATDAIDAASLKADAIAEIQAGLATAENQTDILANLNSMAGYMVDLTALVSSGNTSKSFTLGSGSTQPDAYLWQLCTVTQASSGTKASRFVVGYTSGRVVTLDADLPFTPVVGDTVRMLALDRSLVNVGSWDGTAVSALQEELADALDTYDAAKASDLPTDYQQRGVAVTLPATAPAGYGGVSAQEVRNAMALALGEGVTAATGSVDKKLDLVKAKTDGLVAGTPTIVSPVTNGGYVELYRGASYTADRGNAFTASNSAWTTLTDASIEARFIPIVDGEPTEPAAIEVDGEATGATAVRVELSAENTLALDAGRLAYELQVWAVFADADAVPLVAWKVSVKEGRE